MADDRLLWIDLETTGLSKDAVILEVGCIVTSADRYLSTHDAFLGVISPGPIDHWDMAAVEMHEKSGLMRDIGIIGESLSRVDNRLQDFVLRNFPDQSRKIHLAGAGVHFDRPYIERDFPWLYKRLTYSQYDASVLRRWLFFAAIDLGTKKEDVPHRALDDMFYAINDARNLLRKVNS